MPLVANTKHHFALALIAIGVLGMTSGVFGVVAVILLALRDGDKDAGLVAFGCVCASISGLGGLWVFLRGLRVRRRAIEAGSTAHLESGSVVTTSRTEAKKPSFLEDDQ